MRRWIFQRLVGSEHADRDAPAHVVRLPFRILSHLYGMGVSIRNTLYDRSWLRTRRLPWPVISVGGLVAGGVGKTPTVILLAKTLQSMGRRPLVLLRGYGAPSPGSEPVLVDPGKEDAWRRAGDEAVHLARQLEGTPIVAFRDRFRGALWASSRISFDTILLDDGFQHRRLHRDLDLLTLDSQHPFGSGRLLPAGDLREPAGSLRRADAWILTRCKGTASSEMEGRGNVDILRTAWEIQGFFPLAGTPALLSPGQLPAPRVGVVAGIGRPGRLIDDLTEMGLEVAWSWLLPDHEPLREGDVQHLRGQIQRHRLAAALITEKDAVRWGGRLREVDNVYVVRGAARWLVKEDRSRFEEIFGRVLVPYDDRTSRAPAGRLPGSRRPAE